ncbi:DivIVA domain-containing protein [Streptomyces sp. XD-27]|uniref:DivIVA domain-containing protein n=1 Tax=Streptomyces sp. XD-27 TaxID=3062779 RepID=UPI0026F46E5B|nr:DivIVA domain-containing protein [Streptomyces sp. XD-27]WKX74416.1 DivIVA domain-containing protein [Streptomyces sp. XD-27]
MFWFLLIALVAVVGAVTLAVIGGTERGPLPEAPQDRLDAPLPADRPLARADIEALRLPMTLRGYRMADVDDVLGRVGAELAERDARIAELEASLAGAQAARQSAARHAATPPPMPPTPPAGPAASNGSAAPAESAIPDEDEDEGEGA